MGKGITVKFDERGLERAIMDTARRAVSSGIDLECPHCHRKIKVRGGENRCPFCGGGVVLNMDL